MMPRILCPVVFSLLLFQVSCGPGKEPATLAGEEDAAGVVISYLKSTEAGDSATAKTFLADDADYLLSDPSRCKDLIFPIRSTGMSARAIGRERYDSEWYIKVDMKISFGDRMKLIRFFVAPGTPPKLRGILAQAPK